MNTPYAAKLQELLEASYNLPNAVCDLGRVELGPVELEEITHRIYNHEKSGIDAKAHYLLATSGFNAEMVLNDIAHLHFRDKTADKKSNGVKEGHHEGNEPAGPVIDSETPSAPVREPVAENTTELGSVQPEQNIGDAQNNTSSANGQQKGATGDAHPQPPVDPLVEQNTREFNEFVNRHVKIDWNSRKREVQTMLGRKPSKLRAGQPTSGPARNASSKAPNSLLGSKLAIEAENFTPLMAAYAQQVSALCDRMVESGDIVHAMAEAAQKTSTGYDYYILDAWNALELKDPLKFLERQFFEQVNEEVASNRQSAKLGGTPTVLAKIKAYVRLKYYRNGQWDPRIGCVNQTPIWAYLYYLIRAGYTNEALKLVLERTDIFSTFGASFATFFREWAESPTHTLSRYHTELCQSESHQLFRPGRDFDKYHQALYKIIGRCELHKRSLPQVATTTEDWLWLQLMLCRGEKETASASPGTKYTLSDLREYVLKIGPTHFANEPHKYFFILSLLGLWTEAIDFLSSYEGGGIEAETHSVHFAIALAATKNKDFKGDLVPLIGPYTHYFRQSMPSLAVDYICLIAWSPETEFEDSNPDEKGTPSQLAAREGLRELVLEIRKYSELLGDVEVNTKDSYTGSIEKRMALVGLDDMGEYRNSIAKRAADIANKQGYTLDAIVLYRLARDYTNVFSLINSHLGLFISSVQVGSAYVDKEDPSLVYVRLARNVIDIDTNTEEFDSHTNTEKLVKYRTTCVNLLIIAECLELLGTGQYEECLTKIKNSKLLVLSSTPALEEVSALSREFVNYDECLAYNIPRLLLVAMTCIYRINDQLRKKEKKLSTASENAIEQNRARASNCMVYAGLIQFRMPKETYIELTQLEDEI